MADLLREIKAKWSPEPLPPRGTFDGQTVLVTGGTGGLGLATAKHFATLGAAKVVITYRNKPRAETARQQIETAARAAGEGTGRGRDHGVGSNPVFVVHFLL
ncbi:Short-chain dehydrogenase/reductase SDR [Fusarium oxysporum f. sp. vasinfectum]|nr:Short-chain dehydrogenase/reductase SDR [Fusarium oxysporum f. sp. vasinfectum]KAK2931545.1 Short-chain dehydrogenase/reductase SDR [Fusarium oxysporum f. sp. vasinfectum]